MSMPPQKRKSESEHTDAGEKKVKAPLLAYNILYVKDTKAASRFYEDVIGWKVARAECMRVPCGRCFCISTKSHTRYQ